MKFVGLLWILAFLKFTDAAMRSDRRNPIQRGMRKIEDLPYGTRSAIANALADRNRSSEFLKTVPEVYPLLSSRTVVQHNYPWYARILYFYYDTSITYYLFCGGTVYNQRTIITAAHCTEDSEQADGYFVVIAGEHDRTVSEGLEQTVLVDDVRNIRIRMFYKFSPVNFVTNRKCRKVLSPIEYSVTPTMVCSIEPNAGTCWGDSGGPNGCYDNNGVFYMVGVTSWSPKPNLRCGEYANVYMRVSKYLRWIRHFSYRV